MQTFLAILSYSGDTGNIVDLDNLTLTVWVGESQHTELMLGLTGHSLHSHTCTKFTIRNLTYLLLLYCSLFTIIFFFGVHHNSS